MTKVRLWRKADLDPRTSFVFRWLPPTQLADDGLERGLILSIIGACKMRAPRDQRKSSDNQRSSAS
jgi:hypothetical protein